MDAIRINQGKYETEARLKGFKLIITSLDQKAIPVELYPEKYQYTAPGFDEE
jgi:hypothetical protein